MRSLGLPFAYGFLSVYAERLGALGLKNFAVVEMAAGMLMSDPNRSRFVDLHPN